MPSTLAAASAAATSSGWATAVSLISSAVPAVPSLIRSHFARSDQFPSHSATPGSSSHDARNPGTWAPCPGAVMTSTFLLCTVGVRHTNREGYELLRLTNVEILQTMFAWVTADRTQLRAIVRTRPGRH